MTMSTSQRSRLLSFVPKIFRSNNHPAAKIDLSARNAIQKTQKNSKFAQLPEDILLLIMENLRKEAKVNVIKTCRSLRSLLEFTLYTHLSPIDPWDDSNRYKTGLLHRSLVGREDLIPCIRSYRGLLLPRPTYPSSKLNAMDRLWRRTGLYSSSREDTPITDTEAFENAVFVFSRACNITILEFTDRDDWTSHPHFEPIRAAVSKMSLVRLRLNYCKEPAQVLRPQLLLEHLEISCLYTCSTLNETYLPKLRSLKALLKEASEIVPGNPIEELDLTWGYSNWNDERFKRLTLSTKPITRFSLRLEYPWLAETTRGTLQLISQNLPDIEHLTIIVAGCISDQMLLDEIPSFQSLRNVAFRVAKLATFPVQDGIDAAQNNGPTHQAHALGDWEDLTTRLKTMCPFLVHVEHTPLTDGFACCPSTA